MRCWAWKPGSQWGGGRAGGRESLDMVFKHDHVEYPEDSRVNVF